MKTHVFVLAAVLGLNYCAFGDGANAAAQPQKTAAETKEAPQGKKADAAQEEQFDLLEAIGLLRGNSVVLEVGDKKLTWRDAHPSLSRILKANQKENDAATAEKRIRDVFQAITSRGLLLCEAEAMNVTVSDEERKAFEADLEKNLEGNDRGMTKEKFIASFNKNGSNMANLSYDDVLRLMKLDKIKFGNITISDKELAFYIRYRKAVNELYKQKNDETKKAFSTLLDMPGINTDEGFQKIAREYSEGMESENGGILNYDFTREDLAEVNDLKSFDWKVGETTPVLETENDLRIMRILSVLPKQKEGDPEKFRVAQILHGKIPLMDVDNKEAITAEMLTKKKKKAIDDFVQELQAKYKVASRLFPDGIWLKEEEQKTPKRQTEVVELNNQASRNAENGEKQPPTQKKDEKSKEK